MRLIATPGRLPHGPMHRFARSALYARCRDTARIGALSLCLALLFGHCQAGADTLVKPRMEVNGFASIKVATLTDDSVNQTLGREFIPYEQSWSAQAESLLGLQSRYRINDEIKIISQVNISNSSESNAELDWAYLSYTGAAPFNIRIGKLRRPLFRYSDYGDLGFSYPWVRPPQEAYGLSSIYGSIDAIDVLHEFDLNSWNLTTEFYFGQQDGTIDTHTGQFDFSTRNDAGLILTAEKFSTLFRFSVHQTDDMTVRPSLLANNLSQLIPAAQQPLVQDSLDFLSTEKMDARFLSLAAQYPISHQLNFHAERIQFEARSLHTVSAWYAGLEYAVNNTTFYYTHGSVRQYLSGEYKNQLSALLTATGASDPALTSQLFSDFRLDNSGLSSNTIGLRRVLSADIAASFEWSHLDSRNSSDSSNLFSASVDFLFR